jgi:hypothetical protein
MPHISEQRHHSTLRPEVSAMRKTFYAAALLLVSALVATPAHLKAQASQNQPDPTLAPTPKQPEPQHGRKYKAPPATSHIEVLVTAGHNDKPVTNAAVIFHPLDEFGHDEGSYEVKTDPDGKATIDVIPQNSSVILQVIAPSYSTYGQTYEIKKTTENITVKMVRPRTQYSAYATDTANDRANDTKPGVQEPNKPMVPKPPPTAGALSGSAAANSNANHDLTGITTPNATPVTPATPTTTTPTPQNQ